MGAAAAVVGTEVIGTAVVGTAVVGTAVVGTAVVGTAVVGTAVEVGAGVDWCEVPTVADGDASAPAAGAVDAVGTAEDNGEAAGRAVEGLVADGLVADGLVEGVVVGGVVVEGLVVASTVIDNSVVNVRAGSAGLTPGSVDVAVTANVAAPTTFAVPVITPVVDSDSPGGRAPAVIDHA